MTVPPVPSLGGYVGALPIVAGVAGLATGLGGMAYYNSELARRDTPEEKDAFNTRFNLGLAALDGALLAGAIVASVKIRGAGPFAPINPVKGALWAATGAALIGQSIAGLGPVNFLISDKAAFYEGRG